MDDQEITFEGGLPNSFQQACARRVISVLSTHGINAPVLHYQRGAKEAFWLEFTLRGEECVLAIYEDEVNMFHGKALLEPYMHAEFRTDETLIEGFASRLDRYLGGGPWAGPEEKSFSQAVQSKIANFLRGLIKD
jgi:hypothetical protein